MTKKLKSIDGLMPRRPSSELGERRFDHAPQPIPKRIELRSASDMENETIGKYREERAIGRSEIDESLESIGGVDDEKMSRRHLRRLRKSKIIPKKGKKHKKLKIILSIIGVLLLIVLGFIGYKAWKASGNVFTGGIFGLLQNKPLKEDANGRSNFLILGSTDDDPNHPGNNLTDTIMVVSIDQKAKNAYMFNVPRDLYVQYGMACPAGYAGKINAYFSCSDSGTDAKAEQDRLTKTEQFVGNILGMSFQYGVHVNSVVVRDAVNAVGGIDVDIQGDGAVPAGVEPGSILDRNFDWGCNYTCYKVKYSPGVHHLNGNQAMYLAMARGDTAPTYGLARSNFDREQNQQKILQGLRTKATSTGFLANLNGVTKLIDAVGDNLRTNIPTDEFRTMVNLASEMKSSDIHSIDFQTQDPPIFTSGNMGAAGSVVYPSAGVDDYSGLQAFLKRTLSANAITRENAKVVVMNGTTTSGLASTQATILTDKGFNVTDYTNADTTDYKKTVIYQLHDNFSATATKLSQIYGVEVSKSTPPFSVNSATDFVIVIGADQADTSQ